MRDLNITAQVEGQVFEVLLEKVLTIAVAAATIAQQQ